MTVEEIRAAYYTQPFQPFVVRLNDGRTFRVPKRNYIAISPIGDEIVIAQKDSFELVEIANVEALELSKKKGQRHRA